MKIYIYYTDCIFRSCGRRFTRLWIILHADASWRAQARLEIF